MNQEAWFIWVIFRNHWWYINLQSSNSVFWVHFHFETVIVKVNFSCCYKDACLILDHSLKVQSTMVGKIQQGEEVSLWQQKGVGHMTFMENRKCWGSTNFFFFIQIRTQIPWDGTTYMSGCIFPHPLNISGNSLTDKPRGVSYVMLSLVKLAINVDYHFVFFILYFHYIFPLIYYIGRILNCTLSYHLLVKNPRNVLLSLCPFQLLVKQCCVRTSFPLLQRTCAVLLTEPATVTIKVWTLEPGCLIVVCHVVPP